MKVKVIVPNGLVFNALKLARAIENTLEGAAKDVKVDFDTTTQTWKERPEFTIERKAGVRTVATDDEVYGYVNDGTPPHVITAHGPGGLVFGVPSSPKTRVRVIGSRAGSQGSSIVHTRQVHHPGTQARAFDDAIKGKWDDMLGDVFQRAIDSEV